MDTAELKALVIDDIDARQQQLGDLSLKIHSNPELAFKEYKAVTWLTEYLEGNGFSVEKGICKMQTAFRGSYGEGKPVIAILAEYDALPKVGHACGHNLIAASAVGAGVAARLAVDRFGGRILVIGTPGEELFGGKAIMADRGAFDDVDMAMMIHPAVINAVVVQALACQGLKVEFFGKAAHAAARPEVGINALEAMIQSFAGINSLRQHIKDKARIHGIITDGGEAPNIVPAHSAAEFVVRAEDDRYLDEIKEKVINCFTGAAMATGATLEYKWAGVQYVSMLNNLKLARLFRKNMQSLGRKVYPVDAKTSLGSTDMGNVSQRVPGIHPLVAIAPLTVSVHSAQFASAAVSAAAMHGLLDGAKAMAMTVVDLLGSPETVARVQYEFKHRKRAAA